MESRSPASDTVPMPSGLVSPPHIPHKFSDQGLEFIPLSRKANPLILLRNIRDLVKIMKNVDLVHFQKCFHFAAVPVVWHRLTLA